MSLVAESAPDFVFVKNARYEIVYANPAFLETYPPEVRDSVLGTTTVEHYTPEAAEAFLRQDRDAFETGSSEVVETVCFPDRKVRILNTKKVRFENDYCERFVLGVARDVTDERLIQSALEEQTERFQLALDGAAVGIWEWTLTDNSQHFSTRVHELLGYPPDTPPDHFSQAQFLELVHPDDRQLLDDATIAHLRDHEPFDVEYRIRRVDGELIWVHARGQALWDNRGNPYRMAGSISDVTVRRQATDKLLAANAELERFAFVASHDLQEPLRMLSSFSGLLTQELGGELSEAAREYLGIIENSAIRMRSLILDLLSYARLNATQRRDHETDLNDALAEALTNLTGSIDESGACIQAMALPTVALDPDQATSLLQNLIGNAIKYRQVQSPPQIGIACERDGGTVRLRVSDNGIGIKAAYWEQIFEPFKRLGRDQPGTGMGLAICRRIVEHAGGNIAVRSEPDCGSTFTIELPAIAIREHGIG
ncbi:MAG: ATP-binding protein [Pseudomonadota bacterium]